MLRLKPNPTFKAPVEIRAAGGEVFKVTFEFKHRTQDALAAFIESAEWRGMTDAKAIMAIASGWDGVDGEFGEDALRDLCQNYHGAASAIVKTYLSELTAARLGN